ncbi:MAG: hypothetical protein KDD82_13645, partial [Planctomycetes bacterium]|nr:hypothetical protein [Planctomycetota bacterium]
EDAPPIPAELRRLELGAEVLGRALDAAPVEWAEYGRALAARARGESGLALELAERDAEARPTARGWQLVAELKRDAGDAAGAQAAEQRAKSLGSQRR